MLKHTVHRSLQLSADLIATDVQTWCGFQISTPSVARELHRMGLPASAAASKPCVT